MGGIFISYRRNDVAGQVGRLFARLAAHYGEDFIFMDVESIRPSEHFESIIQTRIDNCDIVLIAIGPQWQIAPADSSTSKDFVRLEIAAAVAARRSLCPLLIDRREPPDAVQLPPEFRQILDSQSHEIRHSTFDSDADRLIAGLEKKGIRPPASYSRQRVEDSLLAAGRPYSWLGEASRALGPRVLAATVVAALALAGWSVSRNAYSRGVTDGDARAREDTAAQYELEFKKDRREANRITGLVTDGTQAVEEADVVLTNVRNHLTVSDKTDSRGRYNVDLENLDVKDFDVIRFEVKKSEFRQTVESITYYAGFREFRAVLRK